MRPMATIRRWHMQQLQCTLNALEYIAHTTDSQHLTTFRERDEGWTIAEVLGHLLDCERLFLERARLTMTEDCPDLPFPDQNDDVRKGHYNTCDPDAILRDWRRVRGEYLDYLSTVPEDSWSREGKHPVYAPLSLNDQLFLACWHDQLHTDQIIRILTKNTVHASQE